MLGRSRNLQNDTQQTKLFELFRKYNIDATPLGMGTNRYGFKLKSYAIKFATNEDGRIDNFKEFKMSKVLQPYVIKIHEVSENGSLLVGEYIQPFESYEEMLRYESSIRKILAELSSLYLLGDVGISKINFGNWGLRPGTTQPVCLDFAYIYNVSSELFLCPESSCRGRVMLVPTPDYAKLRCPHCGKEKTFELIRIKIGKEQHLKEIGDLTTEGYLLSNSNSLAVLDIQRSPYLQIQGKKRKKEKDEKETTVEEVDDFVVM